MAETPATIARKAKGLQQGLKDLMKDKEPWDKEVEFQRKDLRKKYLTLLLLHPSAKESEDVEMRLWLQTSYNFILPYKQRLAALDNAIQAAKSRQQQPQQQGRRGDPAPIVEHRKLTQRFKQFLAEEGKFYTQFILRYYRQFALDEVRSALLDLQILSAVEEPKEEVQLDDSNDIQPQRRPHAIFPPEDAPQPPPTQSERSGRLNTLIHPYDTAAGNFGHVLDRAYRQWKNSDKERKHALQGSNHSPTARVGAFTDSIVLLHALWRLDPRKMDNEAPGHANTVLEGFKSLTAERILTIDVITKVVVASQGALWKHRMVRDSSASNKKPNAASATTEKRIFIHLLSVHRVLLEVGLNELKEPPQAENDLAERISAVFRRTLPALRIAGKWLKANSKYLLQATRTSDDDDDPLQAFWRAYAQFFSALVRSFPLESLPSLQVLLEEDIDMKGFLPLRKAMGTLVTKPDTTDSAKQLQHPNVEQLMRIHDLLTDAKSVVSAVKCPVSLHGDRFVLKSVESVRQPASLQEQPSKVPVAITPQQQLMDEIRDEGFMVHQKSARDEDMMTETTSRTEDDPVGDAFKQALASDQEVDDDDDEEQIVWDPRPHLSPVSLRGLPSPPLNQTPMTPVKSPISPIGPPITPTHRPSISAQLKASPPQVRTTAEDLLNSFAVSHRPKVATHPPAPSQPLLFGSGSLSHPNNSIWSATLDDQVMNSAGQHSVVYQSVPHAHHAHSLSQPSSTWQSSQPTMSSQYSQYNLPGALPSPANIHLMQQPISGHHRLPSATLPSSQELYSTTAQLAVAPPQHITNPLLTQQHVSPIFSGQIEGHPYPPMEGALYETPYLPYPPDRSLIVPHGRPTDPRLGSLPPLAQPWGNTG
ncbi:hypothetical protein ONZ45_g5625 [Pleurotus djamor]|nr:hypothetical protein ONZ45_g5625 [Pleurotus djamor]